jgi:predicted CXXCH cytochrome family protein
MDILKQLLGRLHPLLVHLPIGFIILGLLLQWYDRKKAEYIKVIPIIYLWAGISAVLACITGYLQYLGEGYTFDTVKLHLWSGIATALFSFLMYGKLKELKTVDFLTKIPLLALSIVFFILIFFTGHQGGNITHGEDYLVEPLPNSIKSALGFETYEEKEIVLNEENWRDAMLYEDVIKPILNNKCLSCHSPKKSKGDLLLNSEEGILQGGENGEIIIKENPGESQLFSRLVLPKDDEDHMPPKDKTQPSKEEIKLIETWVAHGNPFDKSIGEMNLSKELFFSFFPKKLDDDHPAIEIIAASQDSINMIEQTGLHVDLISKTSNFLNVSCINKPSFSNSDFKLLIPIREQIAKLDLGGTQITDSIFSKLATLPNLTILKLDDTSVTGRGISLLESQEYLKSINLTSSKFEEQYLQVFTNFKKLKKVNLYNTNVDANGVQTLNDTQILIDYGNYQLPVIASDSIIY